MPFLIASAVEEKLLIVLIQLCVIIVAARAGAILFRKIGQPAVVGEIAAGLVLGPSLLGKFAHEFQASIFRPDVPEIGSVFDILSQLGLIFLLFLIGLEFDYSHLKSKGKASLGISLAGIVLPFGLGVLLGHFMHPHVEGVMGPKGVEKVPELGFTLFMGTAMSITAIPILGRMMMEMGISRSRIGAITITAAAVDDASGWIILATVSALVTSGFAGMKTVGMIGMTVGFAALMVFVARPLLLRWINFALKRGDGELGLNALAILFIVIFLCAIATNLIGIFAIFGAFILGSVLSDHAEFRRAVSNQLRNFVTVFFLPIFFTYTGLRTDVGTLSSGLMWVFAGLVSAAAIAGKFGGCAVAARLGGFNWRESTCIGVMMNTRALMELIVINVGHKLGVIPDSVFCMLVMMALLTTVMTTPILMRAMRGTELEPLIMDSGFRRPGAPRPTLIAAASAGDGEPV